MSNVVNIKKETVLLPKDLLTYKELAEKWGFTYGYLHKISTLPNGEGVKRYKIGKFKLSESEVIEYTKRVS